MSMRETVRTALFFLLVVLALAANAAVSKPVRILFVGNSLTYVGNLPAVFTALAAGNGHATHADMLVEGGATLMKWLDSGAVQGALKAARYDYVVLQERGGDFACGFGPQVCHDSRDALHALSRMIRTSSAKPILMGTYQVTPEASARIVATESKAAHDDAMPYVAISTRLNDGRKRFPYADWFAKAGHPGHDLVLLEAVLLYEQLYGTAPQAKALVVRAPMFVPGSKFASPAPVSLPLLPEVPLAGGYEYSQRELESAIELSH